MSTQTPTTQAETAKAEAKPDEDGKRKPNIARPRNRTSKKPPQPMKKSTTETTLTNDPLWKDSFLIDGETGFVNEQSSKEFNADAAGYAHLVEQEYKAISDVDKYYAKSIPASAHAYYHFILYWYEIALIAQKRGTASPDQDKLVRFVSGYQSAVIASGAGEYLEGLGGFQDFTGVKHLLKAREPNAEGHFGRAAAQTHVFYETLPAPAIFYRRVVEDLEASQRGGRASDTWSIGHITPIARQAPPAPEAPPPVEAAAAARAERAVARVDAEAIPDEDEEGGDAALEEEDEEEVEERILPTVNLLGWRKSKPFNANQYAEMSDVVSRDADEGVIIERYKVNRELFELVERRLRECKRYKMTQIPNTTGGSLVQQVTWKPHDYGTSRFKQAMCMMNEHKNQLN